VISTLDHAKSDALAYAREELAESPEPAQFGPIVLIVLAAILSATVQWLVKRCLDHAFSQPNALQRHRLRHTVNYYLRHYRQLPIDAPADALDAAESLVSRPEVENAVCEGLFRLGREVSEGEVKAVRGACAGIVLAMEPE
jgi:hypothetical protein